MRSAPLLLALLLATGCVAMPLAVPPLQLAVAGGVRSSRSDTVDGLDAPVQLRAGVQPLSIVPGYFERRVDFGGGYLLDHGRLGTTQGGYLEIGGFVLRQPLGEGLGRLGVRVQVRMLRSDEEQRWGQGGAVQLSWDWVNLTAGEFSSSSDTGGMVGYSWGEGGLGLFVEGSYGRAGSLRGWAVTGGVVVHVPAAAGIGYAWAWTLL